MNDSIEYTQLFATEKFVKATDDSKKPCRISPVAKRRDGGTRYWCSMHRADATAKYGKPAKKCRAADLPPLHPDEIFDVDLDEYAGGVAMWGAVPAVFDTTRLPMDRGIHVHARRSADETKEVDKTFRGVRLRNSILPSTDVLLDETDAIYYMVSSIFGFDMTFVCCTHCTLPHLDKDYFSVRPHRRHLCAGCGRHFNDTGKSIGNPIVGVRQTSGFRKHRTRKAKRKLKVDQSAFPGGIQIWGSNPAFLWTGSGSEEEGIHFHGFDGISSEPAVDDTFAELVIDGIPLDAGQVRVLMAQNVMPSLRDRVQAVTCPCCHTTPFDQDKFAFTPVAVRHCRDCGNEIKPTGRLRKVVSNPVVAAVRKLGEFAVREPQQHRIELLAESL